MSRVVTADVALELRFLHPDAQTWRSSGPQECSAIARQLVRRVLEHRPEPVILEESTFVRCTRRVRKVVLGFGFCFDHGDAAATFLRNSGVWPRPTVSRVPLRELGEVA